LGSGHMQSQTTSVGGVRPPPKDWQPPLFSFQFFFLKKLSFIYLYIFFIIIDTCHHLIDANVASNGMC
jgi:hypothetical protein